MADQGNAKQFSADMLRMSSAMDRFDSFVTRRLFLEGGRRLILASPVWSDPPKKKGSKRLARVGGALRASWNPSVDVPDDTKREPGQSAAEGASGMNISGAERLYWCNGQPYAVVVDDGLYPNPPKGGYGKTKGGYSIQAPEGMTGPAIQAMDALSGALMDAWWSAENS